MDETSKVARATKAFNYKKAMALTLVFVVLALIGFVYWLYSLTFVATDDAYVNANVVQIAPQVTGQVLELDVQNNQKVSAGQILFRLDPQPFILALKQAQAQLAIDQANLVNAKITAKRIFSLAAEGVVSAQARDDALAKLNSAEAQVTLDKAAIQTAQLNLSYTTVVAPADGWVSNMTLRPQDTVDANQPQFALIANNQFWVDANFKETDLARIKVGASAKIKVDMYPNYTFDGEVESISGGSGNAFALLPPQNATGNWVKVTQRVPVKVIILHPDPAYPLRIGTSALVTIPTRR
jgi:membrane fusion protein, multidrug efflux system